MKRFLFLLASLTICFIGKGQSTLLLDVNSSTCTWKGSAALGAYSIEGNLTPASGRLEVTEGQLISGQLTMDMKSLETNTKDAEKHLKKDDFFDVKKFPEASFTLKSPLAWQTGAGTVTGKIVIKGVSRDIEIAVSVSREEEFWVLVGVLVLDRTDFGITYNSPSLSEQLQDHAIADDIEFTYRLVFE